LTESDDPLSEYLAAASLGQIDHAFNKLRKPGFGTGHEIFEMTGHSPETLGHDGLKYACEFCKYGLTVSKVWIN